MIRKLFHLLAFPFLLLAFFVLVVVACLSVDGSTPKASANSVAPQAIPHTPVLPVEVLPMPQQVQFQQCPGGTCPPQFRINGPIYVNNPPMAPQAIPQQMAAPSRLDHVEGQPVRNIVRAVLRPFRCQ